MGIVCFLILSPIILVASMTLHVVGGLVALLMLPWKR